MGYQISYNGKIYKNATQKEFAVLDNCDFSIVPVINLTSFLKINNLKAGIGISLDKTLTGVTINNISLGSITGATNGLSVQNKNVVLGGTLNYADLKFSNGGSLNIYPSNGGYSFYV